MPLNVQQYLESKTFDDLAAELAIRLTYHESLPLVILNYHQMDSPKLHPIVRECRGLVLHTETHEVIARGFDRFFNWGEVPEEMDSFDFSDFTVTSKEDGSLILIYWFDGEWRVNTRSTFGDECMPHQSFTWREAVERIMGYGMSVLEATGVPGFTYVCELCSPWNKIVRRYEVPTLYLLAIRDNDLRFGEIAAPFRVAEYAGKFGIMNPECLDFNDVDEALAFLEEKATSDPSFEGVVMRDVHGHRWKLKNPAYLRLHKIRGEEGDAFNPRWLLPFVLSGEDDELLTYFPEVAESYYKLKAWVLEQYIGVVRLWAENWRIPDQKEFALAVKRSPFSGVLFDVRKKYGHEQTTEKLQEKWRDFERLILKRFKEDQERAV